MEEKKVTKDYISSFFEQNKSAFLALREKFISILAEYDLDNSKDYILELSEDECVLRIGQSGWVYQEKTYGFALKEEE